jgi:hypothetical protein
MEGEGKREKGKQVPLFYESYGEPAYVAAPVGLLAEFAVEAGAEAPEIEWLFHEGALVKNPHHAAPKKVLH